MSIFSVQSDLIESIIDSYLSPNDKNMHKIFMPLSQYPKIYGLKVNNIYNEIIVENIISFNLEFVVEDENQYDIEISIGEVNLKLIKNIGDKRGKVYYLERQIASLPIQKHFTICMRIVNNELYLAINERRLFSLRENVTDFEIKWLFIKVHSTSISLLSQQFYDETWNLKVKEFGYLNNTVSNEIYNTSPKYVLLWEHRSKELYHALLIACELINKKANISSDLEKKIFSFADLVFKILTAWPKWRPSSYTSLGEGTWETNNWCNGYIPGAYALASKILQKESFDDFFTKGIDWLVDKRNVQDIRMIEKFPPVVHWVNRSTNHGIVILSTILVGACVLGVFKNEKVDLLYNDLKEIIAKSFADGSYLESVSYFQFVALELIPLFHYLSKLTSLTLAELGDSEFKELSSSLIFINAVTNQNTGKYFAVYGDCEPNPKWFVSVLKFVIQLNGTEGKLDFDFDTSNGKNELYYQFMNYENRVVKRTDRVKSIHTQYHIFEINGFTCIKHYNLENNFYLWINGSKLHKTHNKDNDLGSFYLDDSKGNLFIKKQGLDIRNHNVVLIKELLINDIVVSAEDLDINEYKLPRNINGNIAKLIENNDLYVFKHETYSYFIYRDSPLIKEHIRYYVILKESKFNLIIVDKIVSPNQIIPEAKFHLNLHESFYRNEVDGSLGNHSILISSIGDNIELIDGCISNTSSDFSNNHCLITFIRCINSSIKEADIITILREHSIID